MGTKLTGRSDELGEPLPDKDGPDKDGPEDHPEETKPLLLRENGALAMKRVEEVDERDKLKWERTSGWQETPEITAAGRGRTLGNTLWSRGSQLAPGVRG